MNTEVSTEEERDDECRVCRGGPEESRPLHHPCLCKGSIGYVHQTCLEEWLIHSNKSVCELCHMKYQFTPHYSSDMPEVIPLTVIVRTTLQHFLPSSMFFLFRLIPTLFLWFVVMPLCVCWLYRIWLPRAALVARLSVGSDIVSGMTIASVIALSFILVMSFTDFLRNHWEVGEPRPRRRRVRRGAQPQPQPLPVQQNAPAVALHGVAEARDDAPVNAPPAQQQAPPNNNNAIAGMNMGMGMGMGAEAWAEEEQQLNNEDEGDMHLALDELLGLRGPWHVALRNVMWLLLFDTLYIGLFGFVPYNLGLSLKLAATYYLHTQTHIAQYMRIPSEMREACEEFMRLSQESRNDLQLPVVGLIALGFFVMACVAVLLSWLMSHMHSTVPRVFKREYVAAFNDLAVIIKVGVLLFHRIFVLPVVLGSALLACQRGFIEYPSGAWTHFAANNIVGFLSLPWAMGISFMLTVTLAVLQLREVLHPEILARIIRPQEAHADLLKSLKQEPVLTHARRTVVSMLVYLAILFLFVFLPIRLCVAAGGPLFPMHVKVWYFLPEIQLPVELSIAHIAFLTVLERRKDVIGKVEHVWFRFVCGYLGISRFVLPYELSGADGSLALMNRPAPNWDAHNGDNVSRWAWGDEAAGEAEASVAPRIAPHNWVYKSLALLALSWLLVVCAELCVLFVPVLLGQLVCYVLQVPAFLHHDPLNYIIGVALLVYVRSRFLAGHHNRALLALLERALENVPAFVLAKVGELWIYHLMSCLSFSLLISLAKLGLEQTYTNMTVYGVARDQLLGFALVHVAMVVLVHGWLEAALAVVSAPFPLSRWAEAVRATETLIVRYLAGRDWTALYGALRVLERQLVLPVFLRVCPLPPIIVLTGLGCSLAITNLPLRRAASSSFVYTFEYCLAKSIGALSCCAFVYWISKAAEVPVSVLARKVYGMVRDQNYLVGKRLQDVSR